MPRSQKQKVANSQVTNARRHLRKLQIEAYASAVDVFRAQGVLTKEKLEVLENLGRQFEIPIERHYAELRRALSDGELNSTAKTLIGFDPSPSWFDEAKKFADNFQPFIPKARFTTNAFRAISNYYTNQKLRDLLPQEEETVKNGTEVKGDDKGGEHPYHTRIHPLAAKILAEWGSDLENSNSLSRSFITPVGLEELTDAFPDQELDFADLENPPLSPSEDVTIDNYALSYGTRRGTEPKTLSAKRRRCVSEHKSHTTDDTPSIESRRSSDKNTPSNLSKIMQDYQTIMNLTKKKKIDQTEPSTDRRRKGKKSESVTQESHTQVSESKNRSGLIVPCISIDIERMPLSQQNPSPGRQQKSASVPTSSVVASPKKPNVKRMKKKQLSLNISDAKPTAPKTPVKQRRKVKLKRISLVVSPKNVTDTGSLKSSQISPLQQTPPVPADSNQEATQTDTSITTQVSEPMEEVTELVATGNDVINAQEQENTVSMTEPRNYESETVTAEDEDTLCDVITDTNETNIPEGVSLFTYTTPGGIGSAEQTGTQVVTEQVVSEQVAMRRKKDSNTSLDIPSPDKIRNEMQSLYSPISSLDTPPDLDNVSHFDLVPDDTPLFEKKISCPVFSPITSPDESQYSDKEGQKLAGKSADRFSLALGDTSLDVLPQKCSLALSDIVEEVCESISDPLSPSLVFTREESKPYTSPDSVFTDSSLMLSKALKSFMSQVISEETMDTPATVSDTTTQLAELLDTQVLPPGEELDFAQISASLLSMDQLIAEPTNDRISPTQDHPADSTDN